MKNHFGKIISLVLALCMVCGMVPAMAESTEKSDLTGTVRFCTAYSGKQGMDALIAAFNEEYPNVTVELKTVGNTANGNIQIDTMLMADEIDVLSSFTLERTVDRTEFFVDLRDYLAADGIDMATEWGAEVEMNGGLYGIPFDGLNCFIAINMTEWENAGLGELPKAWTWDEYLEASRKMTHDGVYGGSDKHTLDAFETPVRQELGSNCFIGEDGMTNFTTEPLWKTAIERKILAENEEKIWKSQVEYNGDGSKGQNVFFQGQVASYVANNVWRFVVDLDNYPHDFKVGFAPYPTQNAESPAYIAGPSIYAFGCITKNCKDFDAAYAFLKFITMEGDRFLLNAGHLPTWKGTDLNSAVTQAFGTEENAEKLIDVESFKRVVLNFDGATNLDTVAYPGISDIEKEVILYILSGEETVDEGLQEMKERCDEIINDVNAGK